MLKIKPHSTETLLILEISGKLSKGDFEQLNPELHRRRDFPRDSRLVMIMDDFKGYDSLDGLWTDLKLDIAHKDDFKKIAIIGDDQLQRGLSKFADMISTGEIKFFATENKKRGVGLGEGIMNVRANATPPQGRIFGTEDFI